MCAAFVHIGHFLSFPSRLFVFWTHLHTHWFALLSQHAASRARVIATEIPIVALAEVLNFFVIVVARCSVHPGQTYDHEEC